MSENKDNNTYKNPFDDDKISNYQEDKEPKVSDSTEESVMASYDYVRGFFSSVDNVFSMISSMFKGFFK